MADFWVREVEIEKYAKPYIKFVTQANERIIDLLEESELNRAFALKIKQVTSIAMNYVLQELKDNLKKELKKSKEHESREAKKI